MTNEQIERGLRYLQWIDNSAVTKRSLDMVGILTQLLQKMKEPEKKECEHFWKKHNWGRVCLCCGEKELNESDPIRAVWEKWDIEMFISHDNTVFLNNNTSEFIIDMWNAIKQKAEQEGW